MKIGGREITSLNEGLLVLPRSGDDIVIKARAIHDWDEFEALCPEPIPPVVLTKEGKKDDLNAAAYIEMLELHALRKTCYIVIKSLEPSKIEWKTVDLTKPSTWVEYEKELLAGNLTQIEVNMCHNLAMEVNQLDESKLKEARDSFVRGQQQE